MRGWRRPALAWLALAVYLLPASAFAQATKAGVVTTLEGNVTAARAVAPQPVVLKFKDDVYLQDRVVTGEQSFARLLLGGKAVVSIRERSAVTITEVPGRSTIDIESGKIALSVARDRMQPGEVINIKTPNAVAGVRGTVVVAQVAYSLVGGAQQPVSNLWVLRGVIEAVHTNAAGVAIGVPVPVSAMQSFSATPTSASTGTFTLQQMSGIVQGLQSKGTADPGTASQAPARLEAVNTAVALLSALTGSPAVQQLATGTPQTLTTPPTTTPNPGIDAVAAASNSPTVLSLPELPPLPAAATGPDVPDVIIDDQLIQLIKDQTLKTFSGTSIRGGTSPVIRIVDSLVEGPDSPLVVADSTANTTLQAGPLMKITNSTLDVSRLLLVQKQGTLTALGTSPLISLDPVTVNAQTLIEVAAGGKLSLAGPLLTDLNGRVATKEDAIVVAGTVTGTGAAALVGLQGTTLTVVSPAPNQETLGRLLNVFAGPITTPVALPSADASVSLAGPLLLASAGSTMTMTDVIGIFRGASVVRETGGLDTAFIGLDATRLEVGRNAAVSGVTNIDGSVANITGVGGTSGTIGSSLTLKSGGALLEAKNGAFVDVRGANGNVVRLDSALLDATAPVIALIGLGTQLQTSNHAISVNNNSTVESRSPDAFIRLESQARMDVLAGHLVNVSASKLNVAGDLVKVSASRLNVAGDLVRMTNNAALNVNGLLLNILSGSTVNINGALVGFFGNGNTINITNNILPTAFISGIPVSIAQGASVNIASGSLAGLNRSGTITINNVALPSGATAASGSLIKVDANATLRIGPPSPPN